MTTLATENAGMKPAERAALRRIVKDRFLLLRRQVEARKYEVANAQRAAAIEAKRDVIAKATRDIDKLNERLAKIEAERLALLSKYEAQGIVPRYRGSVQQLGNSFIPSGETVQFNGYRGDRAIEERARAIILDLQAQQLKIEEEITVGALVTEQARQFLDQIPSIESLLALPAREQQSIEQ